MTVHNYRLRCINGLHYRDNRVCTDCVGPRLPYAGVRHGCYRGSRLQSLPMAVGQVVHRPTWRHVSRFLALTPFLADALHRCGFDSDRAVVRPTWTPDTGMSSAPPSKRVLYVGRLDDAKGPTVLTDAWRIASLGAEGWVLRVIGAGPLEGHIRSAASADSS